MRVSRRAVLGLGGAGALALAGARLAFSRTRGSDERADIAITATPIETLLPSEPHRTQFGSLNFRSGLVLGSPSPSFGGLSALWRSGDGQDLVSLSDNAMWLTSRVAYHDGRLANLVAAHMAPILGEAGEPLWQTRAYDTESLAMADGMAFIGIERVHEVRRFAWARDGVAARGEPVSLPPEVKTLPDNSGLEALAVAPNAHPLAGALIAIAEQARSGGSAPTKGWVLTGSRTGAFDVARSGEFDITDIAFLETGEALLLERRYNLRDGVACRIRRLAVDAIHPGATVDGTVIFEADRSFQIDNMEGISVHRDAPTGERVVTLVSDDNFNPLQRTLLLEFTLAEPHA